MSKITQPFICFHKWSRWSEPVLAYDKPYQGKVCHKCGKVKSRSASCYTFPFRAMQAAYSAVFRGSDNG